MDDDYEGFVKFCVRKINNVFGKKSDSSKNSNNHKDWIIFHNKLESDKNELELILMMYPEYRDIIPKTMNPTEALTWVKNKELEKIQVKEEEQKRLDIRHFDTQPEQTEFKMGQESVERRGFSDKIKEKTLIKQKHRCNICSKLLNVVDYDHIDGNRANNDIDNCQALCPNCHAEKTRRAQSHDP